jgi:putative transcriptional regulator
MITYDPLWKTMKEKNISQYRLVKAYGFSAGQLNRLKNNQYVSTHTIGVLCTILECSVEDIMEFRMDKSEGLYPIMETVPKQPEEDETEESEPKESVPEESGAPC